MLKQWILLLLIVLVAGWSSALGSGCSGPMACINGISPISINPNGNLCQEDCECNNQNHEGICVQGRCNSISREPCVTIKVSENGMEQAKAATNGFHLLSLGAASDISLGMGLRGRIDEVRFYNGALKSQEILLLFRKQ